MHRKRTLITLEGNAAVTASGAVLSVTAALWQQISPGVHSDLITEALWTFIAVLWATSRRAPISCLLGEAVARAHAPPLLRYFSHYTILLQCAQRCGIYFTHFSAIFPPSTLASSVTVDTFYLRKEAMSSVYSAPSSGLKKSVGLITIVNRKFSLYLQQLLRTREIKYHYLMRHDMRGSRLLFNTLCLSEFKGPLFCKKKFPLPPFSKKNLCLYTV